mmetsp:Transcript_13637/g.29578  ORF Transcript_13637/g.29578 Transcript_13637/m.29578 type:complete len:340 (-) Transcript_13637:147-1166(-)
MIQMLFIAIALLSTLTPLLSCQAFTATTAPSHHQQQHSSLSYQTVAVDILRSKRPSWVPLELIELAAADAQSPLSNFILRHTDMEAFTSCDDESDELHECDFFGQYLGPTKWVHLTSSTDGDGCIEDVHFEIWKDSWRNPSAMVEVADRVGKEVIRYYEEFMLRERDADMMEKSGESSSFVSNVDTATTSSTTPSKQPQLVRVKVVPASFGIDGFEDVVWESTEEMIRTQQHYSSDDATPPPTTSSPNKAITFVVASPDLSDSTLLGKSSPQMDFSSDKFKTFASSLEEKLNLFSTVEEGVDLSNIIELTSFHPLWRGGDEGMMISSFPYPCVAVSTCG